MSAKTVANANQPLTLEDRRAFARLPLVERRRQMAKQAKQMAQHKETLAEKKEREAWQGGDLVEY